MVQQIKAFPLAWTDVVHSTKNTCFFSHQEIHLQLPTYVGHFPSNALVTLLIENKTLILSLRPTHVKYKNTLSHDYVRFGTILSSFLFQELPVKII